MLEVTHSTKASLTIAALADEKSIYLAGFVAAHLAQGAEKVIVYLDRGTENPFHSAAGTIDGLEIICCDDAFWQGKRPKNLEVRQRYCYEHAYKNAQTEWVGLCDADEIFVPVTNYAQELAKTKEDDQMIACPVWEAVWEPSTSYEGLFSASHARRRVRDEQVRKKMLPKGALFDVLSRDGLIGHVFGKYLIRRGVPDVQLKLHSAQTKTDQGDATGLVVSKTASLQLLHYDAMSLSAWEEEHQKLVERQVIKNASRAGRVAQTEMFLLLASRKARKAYFEIIYTINPKHTKKLINKGFLQKISIDKAIYELAKNIDPETDM